MALRCPKCRAKSLSIAASIELPPDARSDEITLQMVRCAGCKCEAVAVYEESRRGSLDSESWNHTAYEASREAVRALRRMVRECPDPRNARCDCRVHKDLSGGDYRKALPGVEWGNPFAFEMG